MSRSFLRWLCAVSVCLPALAFAGPGPVTPTVGLANNWTTGGCPGTPASAAIACFASYIAAHPDPPIDKQILSLYQSHEFGPTGTYSTPSWAVVYVHASCPSGYTQPTGDPYCEPTPPPSCKAGQLYPDSSTAVSVNGPTCIEGCMYEQPAFANNAVQTGASCTPPPAPPPTTPCDAPNEVVGTVNGVPLCLPPPPNTPAGKSNAPPVPPASSPSTPLPSQWVPYTPPTPPASSALGSSTSGSAGASGSGSTGSSGASSSGSTSGGSSSGTSGSGASGSGGGASGAGGSSNASGASTSSSGSSSTSSSTTCVAGVCTTTTTTTPVPTASNPSPAPSASSSGTATLPAGLGSSPYSPSAAGLIGIPSTNPFTLPATPAPDVPGNSGTCGPMDWKVGAMDLQVNICPYLDAIRPVLDWAVMAFGVIAAIGAILARA